MSSCELYDNIVLHTNFSLFVRIISTIADGEEKPEVQCFMEDKMSVQLLDKTRKINKLLHNNNSSKVVFNDICEVLTEILPVLEAQEDYSNDALYAVLCDYVAKKGCKNGYVMWPIRTAVSGKQMTPGGATELMEVLGKEESIARIKKGIELLNEV